MNVSVVAGLIVLTAALGACGERDNKNSQNVDSGASLSELKEEEEQSGVGSANDLRVEPILRNSLDDNSQAGAQAGSLSSSSKMYIVELNDPAVASYKGSIQGLSATSPAVTGLRRLDVKAKESRAYSAFLTEKQNTVLQSCQESFGRKVEISQRYQHSLNGFALSLNAKEAARLAEMPGVKRVSKSKIRPLLTDVGPQWVGAGTFWNADENAWPRVEASKGEGVVIAVFDSGINSGHPAFADLGGDGYDHVNPLGSGHYLPGSYCDTVDPSFCNDKVIGAWVLNSRDQDPTAPHDDMGHGSHTASIAAGNLNQGAIVAPTTRFERSLSGVAPHANLVIYDTCYQGSGGCPDAAILAALEQLIIDSSELPQGIQAVNFSIGINGAGYADPISLGFLNVSAAGIFVAAAAGNDGPSPETLTNIAPWMTTVAASTHNRVLSNKLVNISSDEGRFDDISGESFTASYGPAALVYAGDFPTANGSLNDEAPEDCNEPFPAGHFNGEIVICHRGDVPRVEKGENVLAGGAGGLVLVNPPILGDQLSSDLHVLPGVNISVREGDALIAWLAEQSNAVATITGVVIDESAGNGDQVADFSSRGPVSGYNLLKPDISAPGKSVLAAYLDFDDREGPYDFLDGTSMAAPHVAGAAALIAAVRPSWSPFQIKSALMMSALNRSVVKEDGATAADAFDVGAGRLNLSQVQNVDLLLDESPENFLAADPARGGDPATLNLPSMQSDQCVESCRWTRRLENVGDHYSIYDLQVVAPEGLALTVSPQQISLHPGETADIEIVANTAFASEAWQFATLNLTPLGFRHQKPELHMPISIKPARSTNTDLLEVSIDSDQLQIGQVVKFETLVNNRELQGAISITAEVPQGVQVLTNSSKLELVGGIGESNLQWQGRELTWQGELRVASINITTDNPFVGDEGYTSISAFTEPAACPRDCDEGSVALNVPEFTYNGEKYSQVVWSVNGTVQVGAESKGASSLPVMLPSQAGPNNLLAPFWADLDLSSEEANWYVNVVAKGEDNFIVFEWQNVPSFINPELLFNFQVWIQAGDSGNIWYAYGDLDDFSELPLSVGAENADGLVGLSYYHSGEGVSPQTGQALKVDNLGGGLAKLSFLGLVNECSDQGAIIARVSAETESGSEQAIASAQCVR